MTQKNKIKVCLKQFGLTCIILLLVIAAYIYIIDPFMHYHAPYSGIASYVYEQVYQTPGLIDNMTYDSAIIGTSMTENFRASWFDDKQYNTVKLSYAGGKTKDIRTIYDRIFSVNPGLKFVWTDIEAYQLLENPDSRGREYPKFLYNDNPIDDVQYLWNGDVFWSAIHRTFESLKGITHDIDKAYTWEEPELFSAKKMVDVYKSDFENYKANTDSIVVDENEVLAKKELCKNNMQNIIPVIEQHPDTEFVFFFPPYSAVYWHRIKLEKELWILDIDKLAAEELLKYPNVSVYYFQDEYEYITNLDMYRDECHHHPLMNKMIFDKIWNEEKRITNENIDSYFDGMKNWVNTYDFDDMWRRIEEE